MTIVNKAIPSFLEWCALLFRDTLWRKFIPTVFFTGLGIFIIPFLLFWAKERPLSTSSLGKQYSNWRNIQWPTKGIWHLFRIFSNTEVGCMGDALWPNIAPKWALKLGLGHPITMWYLMAIRTPVQGLKYLVGVSIDPDVIIAYCGDYEVGATSSDVLGVGWRFVKTSSKTYTVYGLHIVHMWSDKIVIHLCIGYNVKSNANLKALIIPQNKIHVRSISNPDKK